VLLLKEEDLGTAKARLDPLNDRLAGIAIPGSETPIDLRASVGLSEFVDATSLHRAIDEADRQMYRRKKTA
jgi:PleD family two-component response regulator